MQAATAARKERTPATCALPAESRGKEPHHAQAVMQANTPRRQPPVLNAKQVNIRRTDLSASRALRASRWRQQAQRPSPFALPATLASMRTLRALPRARPATLASTLVLKISNAANVLQALGKAARARAIASSARLGHILLRQAPAQMTVRLALLASMRPVPARLSARAARRVSLVQAPPGVATAKRASPAP